MKSTPSLAKFIERFLRRRRERHSHETAEGQMSRFVSSRLPLSRGGVTIRVCLPLTAHSCGQSAAGPSAVRGRGSRHWTVALPADGSASRRTPTGNGHALDPRSSFARGRMGALQWLPAHVVGERNRLQRQEGFSISSRGSRDGAHCYIVLRCGGHQPRVVKAAVERKVMAVGAIVPVDA